MSDTDGRAEWQRRVNEDMANWQGSPDQIRIARLKAEVERLRADLAAKTQAHHDVYEAWDRLRAENERLREALRPFAEALKGNWSKQPDDFPLDVGFGATDLRLKLRLGDFRRARAAMEGK